MNDSEGWILGAVITAIVAFCFIGGFIALRQDAEHQRFLQQHGCQLLMSADTGRSHLVGKIRHNEKVYVYECAYGTRTEVE